MKKVTVELDQDVYDYLAKKAKPLESGSDLLRRLLRIDNAVSIRKSTVPRTKNIQPKSLQAILQDPEVVHYSAAIDRYLAVLGGAHYDQEETFGLIIDFWDENTPGRVKRFAKSREGIESSGRNTQPRKIPGSIYWISANLSNENKCKFARDTLDFFNYPEELIRAAVALIRG